MHASLPRVRFTRELAYGYGRVRARVSKYTSRVKVADDCSAKKKKVTKKKKKETMTKQDWKKETKKRRPFTKASLLRGLVSARRKTDHLLTLVSFGQCAREGSFLRARKKFRLACALSTPTRELATLNYK